jgi:hypothetical protein
MLALAMSTAGRDEVNFVLISDLACPSPASRSISQSEP